jgi:hypothetical protein
MRHKTPRYQRQQRQQQQQQQQPRQYQYQIPNAVGRMAARQRRSAAPAENDHPDCEPAPTEEPFFYVRVRAVARPERRLNDSL